MKKTFVIVLLICAIKSHSQTDTTLKYTEIIKVDSVNKQALYQRARAWANDIFRSSKNVLQIDDKENGEIAGNAKLDATITWNALGKRTAITSVNFKFQIIVKDGKYKYVFTDFTEDGYYGYLLTSANENPYNTKMVSKKNLNLIWTSLKASTDYKIISLINN